MPTLDELKTIRKQKLETLKSKGVDPYPSVVTRTHTIAEAREVSGETVSITGRVMARRGHGKIGFFDVKDASAKVQVVAKADVVPEEIFTRIELIDIGDFIEVTGVVGATEAGEVSIFATDVRIISKSLRPLPDQWYGLTDVEERYRQRYVDLIMNDDVKQVFVTRANVVKFLRNYLEKDGFIEMETPILQPLYGGASAMPFITHHEALDMNLYLRIATELYLKRLIVGGFEKVYELGKDFRNEGMDRQHNPEFTMVEFYWAYANYEMLMTYTEQMLSALVKEVKGALQIEYQGKKLDFSTPWPRRTYRDVVMEYAGIDIDVADTEEKLSSAIKEKKVKMDTKGIIGYGALLDMLYKETARPHLLGPMFLTDRPTAFVALAKRLPNDARYTASFQLLVDGKEVLNAYNELNDPIDQADRWRESEKLGKKGQEEYEKFDDDYIRALEYGMPPTAGWGMGIDRLVSILTDQHTIKDVILFPTMRPETGANENVVTQPKEKKETKEMDLGISYETARQMVDEYVKDPIIKMHMRESEMIMRAVAVHLKKDEQSWGIIGLLHDIDWDLTKSDTKNHCILCADILKKHGGTQFLIDTIQSHGYEQMKDGAYSGPEAFVGKKRDGVLEHALAASETLTGLIVSSTFVQPDRKLASLKSESLMKKYKSKSFAANCHREIIAECEQIGIPLQEFLDIGLKALQDIHEELGL